MPSAREPVDRQHHVCGVHGMDEVSDDAVHRPGKSSKELVKEPTSWKKLEGIG
jgi:hypothetical protein